MKRARNKRERQDDARDTIGSELAPHLYELSALWGGNSAVTCTSVTITRSRSGTGTLAVIKGVVLPDGKEFELVSRLGGEPVIAYGFGDELMDALAAVEALLRLGELTWLRDEYPNSAQATKAALKRQEPQPRPQWHQPPLKGS